MLSQRNRLSKQKDFELIFKTGESFRGSGLVIKVKKNNLSFFRFAIVVSCAVSKKAVIRNRLRRQLKEIIQKNEGRIKEGLDIILILKKEFLGKDYNKTKERLESLFAQIKIFK
jgi:ribonuclease P protein component